MVLLLFVAISQLLRSEFARGLSLVSAIAGSVFRTAMGAYRPGLHRGTYAGSAAAEAGEYEQIKYGPEKPGWNIKKQITSLALSLRQMRISAAALVGDLAELSEMRHSEMQMFEIDVLCQYLAEKMISPEILAALEYAKGTLAKVAE